MKRFLKSQAAKLLEITNVNRHLTLVEMESGDWIVLKTWNRKAVLGQYRDANEAFATLISSKALRQFKGIVVTVERLVGEE